MTTPQKIVSAVIGLWLLALTGFMFVQSMPAAPEAGTTNNIGYLQKLTSWFTNTVYFGTSQQTSVSSAGAVTVGSSGTAVTGLNWKNCSLAAGSFTVAASTTVAMDCAMTGATANDFVLAGFGTTTVPNSTTGGWRIVGASASSTSGFDTLQVRNDTGASAVIPAQIASSTRVLNLR